jgi:hypothetical protein
MIETPTKVGVSVYGASERKRTMRIAFDTQVVSYFLSANQDGYDPSSDDRALAREKVAAFCLWMYVGNPVVVPTVFRECEQIPRDRPEAERKNREHFNWNAYHFCEVLSSWLDPKRVDARAAELNGFHPEPKNLNDCRIVAECEEPGARVDALAVFDRTFLKNLSGMTRITVATPYDCLLKARVTEETEAKVLLKPEHPLSGATWWRLSEVFRRWPRQRS